jgi:dienelactone hydrolase
MLSRVVSLAAVAMASMALAEIKVEKIEYKIGNTDYEGVLAYDDAVSGKRPGVLICHEWWGCNQYIEMRARKLAELGYIAFGLDMYGKGNNTSDPGRAREWMTNLTQDNNVLRDRASAGLDVLASNDKTDVSKLAVIGYCMGGTVALELARSGRPHTESLRAIGVFHASKLAATNPEENKRIRGTVLICHGQNDNFVEPEQIEKFHSQMKEAGVDYQFDSYSDSVHAFTNPDADSFGVAGVAYNARADRRSWAALKEILAESLGSSPHAAPSAAPSTAPKTVKPDKAGTTEKPKSDESVKEKPKK